MPDAKPELSGVRGKLLNFRVPPDLQQRFTALCERAGTNPSARMRELLVIDLLIDTLRRSDTKDSIIQGELREVFGTDAERRPLNERKEHLIRQLLARDAADG